MSWLTSHLIKFDIFTCRPLSAIIGVLTVDMRRFRGAKPVDDDDDDAGDAAEPVILDKELFLGVAQSKYADFFSRSNPPGQRPRCPGCPAARRGGMCVSIGAAN